MTKKALVCILLALVTVGLLMAALAAEVKCPTHDLTATFTGQTKWVDGHMFQ
jgi:hypothetical protein